MAWLCVGNASDHLLSPVDALDRHDAGRSCDLSSELAVYYPGEKRFVPDVLAVLDVEPHDRMKWVVATFPTGGACDVERRSLQPSAGRRAISRSVG